MLDEDDRSVQLPIELIDAIFDELGQMDKRALYSCALVCHAWRPLAQTHIFREVSLTIGYHGKAANSDATPQCRTAFRRIRGFFEARPAIAASVRELKLRTIPVVTLKRWDWLLPPATAYHDARSLLYLLRLLPHLEHLDLQDVFVTSAPAAEDEHALASVKTLVISSRQEEIPPSDALLLLNCFKRVEDLEVDVACFYNFCRASVECPPPHRLAIDSVSTQGSMSEALFVHLAQSPSSHVLHTLVLRDLELCPLVGLQRLLAATQANLTRLSLSFSSFCGDPQAETSAVVSLACCSALKSLEISIQASPFDWQAVWQIIATVSAGSNVALEDLTLVLREREQIVVEGMWVFSDRDILSSVHSTLSRLNAHGAFKRFLLKQVASGGWLGEKEVFPDILQSHAGVSR